MSQNQLTFITISCDAPGCEKTATFAATDQDVRQAEVDHPWLTSIRNIGTVDKRQFTYCSDECEIKSVAAGAHNKQTIVSATNQAQVDLAARAAAQARQATDALKTGRGGQIQISS